MIKKDMEPRRMRWLILRVAHAGHPIGASETVIADVLTDAAKISRARIRRELESLNADGLLTLERARTGWFVQATKRGLQVVEYGAPAPTGIARPEHR